MVINPSCTNVFELQVLPPPPPKSNILHIFTLYFISYQYVFQMLEVAGALTHDSFMTISFPQGEGPHVQPPTALLRY